MMSKEPITNRVTAHEILSGEGPFTWKIIDKDTDIMRVVNGWVLRSAINNPNGVFLEQTFIPDTRK
jgi:hypothetical protein